MQKPPTWDFAELPLSKWNGVVTTPAFVRLWEMDAEAATGLVNEDYSSPEPQTMVEHLP